MKYIFSMLILYPLIGACIGYFIPQHSNFLQYFDVVFLRLLNLIVPFLIFVMLMRSVDYLCSNVSNNKGLYWVVGYYAFGTFFSVVLACVVVYFLKSGVGVNLFSDVNINNNSFHDNNTYDNVLLDCLPQNIIYDLYHAKLIRLSILAVFLGVVISSSRYKIVIVDFLNGFSDFLFSIVEYIMFLVPYALLSLSIKLVVNQMKDIIIFYDMLVVIFSLYIVRYIILLLEIYFIGGVSPLPFILGSFKYQSVAFLTTSSKATLPIIVQEVGELGVSKEGQQYAMSIGGILNSIGFGLDLTVMIMFILNAYGISLDIYTCCIVVILSFLSCVLGNGIPAAPLIVLSIVFEIFHVPMDVMVYIIGIDRIIDMCSTVFNVTGIAGYTLIIDGCKNRLNKTKYYQ